MIEALFWAAATSYLVLAVLAAIVIAALVVGYDPLLGFVPVLASYRPIARVIAFVVFGLLCALLDRRAADMRGELAQLRTDLAFSQLQLAAQKAAAADADRLLKASQAAAATAQLKASTYETLILSKPVAPGDHADAALLAVLHGIQPRRGAGSGKSGGTDPARLRGFGKAWPDAGR